MSSIYHFDPFQSRSHSFLSKEKFNIHLLVIYEENENLKHEIVSLPF